MAEIARSRRLRETPFTDQVEAAGVNAYTVYNHMLLPAAFRSIEEDYRHLKTAVQIWDVSCERQVELRGPDTARLAQLLTPRDLRALTVGRCAYAPMVDETGGILNDPVLLKLSDERFWFSIADSDLLFWMKGLALGMRLDVDVIEPDVSPIAVQGPRADELMARMFGPDIVDLRFFRFRPMMFDGVEIQVARSGYSRQGGFELYCPSTAIGPRLWDALMEAGDGLDVRAGCPNLIERIEGGLLSYGNDMTRDNTPYECGLGRFCDVEVAIGCVGRDALLRAAQDPPARQIRSLSVEGAPVPPCTRPWPMTCKGERAGQITSCTWSPDFAMNVALGMVEARFWQTDTELELHCPDGPRKATVRAETFI